MPKYNVNVIVGILYTHEHFEVEADNSRDAEKRYMDSEQKYEDFKLLSHYDKHPCIEDDEVIEIIEIKSG